MVQMPRLLVKAITEAMEQGLLPDWAVRQGIRSLLRNRAEGFQKGNPSDQMQANQRFLTSMRSAPVALAPEKTNEQHYEIPAEFFECVLGPRMKYSCCFYPQA